MPNAHETPGYLEAQRNKSAAIFYCGELDHQHQTKADADQCRGAR